MKRVVFFIAIVVGVLVASCSLDQEVQVTPSVGTSHLICSHADSLYTDTLTAKRNENGVYKIGAIHKGDTVRFMITIVASPNSLTGFSMAYDSTILSIRYIRSTAWKTILQAFLYRGKISCTLYSYQDRGGGY